MGRPLLYLQTTNATSERDWPFSYLALLDHCTHVVDLGHDLQDHVQLRILKKSANRNELQINWAQIVRFPAIAIKVIFGGLKQDYLKKKIRAKSCYITYL